jgi:HEAT repeat protein
VSPKTVSELAALLKNNDSHVRASAAKELGEIASGIRGFVLRAPGSSLQHAQEPGTVARRMTEPEAEAAGPALLDALKDQDTEVRTNAFNALELSGLNGLLGGSSAVPAHSDALKDQDAEVRQYAVSALGGCGEGAVSALVDALKDRDAQVRSRAAYELGRIGVEAKAAVPALSEALKDEHLDVRSAAGEALVRLGPAAEER